MEKKNRIAVNLIWCIIGIIIGAVGMTAYKKGDVKPTDNTSIIVAAQPTLGHILDSLEYAKNATALLVARDSVTVLEKKYRQLLGKFVIGDTVRTKVQASTPIPQTVIIRIRDTVCPDDILVKAKIDTPQYKSQYGLKLPYELNIENAFVGISIGINKDSAILRQLNIYSQVEVEKSEKNLPGYKIQRTVMFKRSNPYITAFSDGYIEEPRLTNKGLILKQAKVAAWTIPITFAATYFSVKQGWIK